MDPHSNVNFGGVDAARWEATCAAIPKAEVLCIHDVLKAAEWHCGSRSQSASSAPKSIIVSAGGEDRVLQEH